MDARRDLADRLARIGREIPRITQTANLLEFAEGVRAIEPDLREAAEIVSFLKRAGLV